MNLTIYKQNKYTWLPNISYAYKHGCWIGSEMQNKNERQNEIKPNAYISILHEIVFTD